MADERETAPQEQPGSIDLGGATKDQVAQWLEGQFQEATAGREGGTHPRDKVWQKHYDQYWGRYDTSKKASWQATEVMPEVPAFVDRFAASMKRALTSQGDFFEVIDPADTENDLANAIKRAMKVWLEQCGLGIGGHPLRFEATFEDTMKLGALALASMRVTPGPYGPRVVTVDPMRVWWDPTGRGMYRIWRYEIDLHEFKALANKPGYDKEVIDGLVTQIEERHKNDDLRRRGTSDELISNRKPIYIDEFLGTIVNDQGEVIARNALTLRANGKFIVRGPEPNPFWHQKDPIVGTPLVTVPLAPYGRAYAENMASVASTFVEMTNLILDASFTGAMKAFALTPEALLNPQQASNGVYPNVTFLLEGGQDATKFLQAIELGGLKAETVQVWQALKKELELAAMSSSLDLGQFAPNGRTSSREIAEVSQGPNEQIASMAETVEQRLLEPILQLVWMTGLQFAKADDQAMINAVGPEMWAVLYARRKELIARNVTFKARGLSVMVEKSQKLRKLLEILQIMLSNPVFAPRLMQKISPDKLIAMIFDLAGIDTKKLEMTPREQMLAMAQMQQQMAMMGGQPGGTTPSPLGGAMMGG